MYGALSDFFYRFFWPWNGGGCPNCGANVIPPRPPCKAPKETLVRCPCGWMGSVISLLEKRQAPSPPLIFDAPPGGSGIVHNVCGAVETWSIPRSGRSGGLLWFGIFWLVFSCGASFFLRRNGIGVPDALLWLFRLLQGTLFPLIGVVIIYAGLRSKFAKHFLLLTEQELSLERQWFGRCTRKALRRESGIRVDLKEFFSKNYVPVYGIVIRSSRGKLRFGSALADDEKKWLVHDLRRALRTSNEESSLVGSGQLEIEENRGTVTFRLLSSSSTLSRSGLIAILFTLAMGAGVQGSLTSAANQSHDGDIPVLIFRIFLGIITLLALAGGWAAIQEGRRRSRTTKVLHAGDDGLTLETIHPGGTGVRSFQKDEVLRVQPTLTSGNAAVRQGEIVTRTRVVLFGRDADWSDLKVICEGLTKALALPEPVTTSAGEFPRLAINVS